MLQLVTELKLVHDFEEVLSVDMRDLVFRDGVPAEVFMLFVDKIRVGCLFSYQGAPKFHQNQILSRALFQKIVQFCSKKGGK